ncbi:hypothetical protein ABZ348_02900 [Streptomyces sp. NPDC005963]|uniref:hypothetical protein n=1 Tax=Streptomyces sp. NPDC005963 TaxID=3156721 RepID=UPI00340CBA29
MAAPYALGVPMKKNRLAAGGAAVVLAAGMAIGATAPATAAPATERIASAEQFHAHLAKAVERESAQAGEISCCPAGQYVPVATGA